jgi:hypothetical protein
VPTLGIPVCSYLYLKLAKTPCVYYFLYFLFNKTKEQEGETGSAQKWGKRKGGKNVCRKPFRGIKVIQLCLNIPSVNPLFCTWTKTMYNGF